MNLLAKLGLLGLVATGTATALYADPVGGWLSPNGTSAARTAPSTNGAPAPTAAPLPATLPLAEVQTRVRALHEQTRADARHIQHLQQLARKEKDVIKLNCVNDKLVQVKPQMNVADAAEGELENAADTTRMSVFETIAQAAEAIRRLREEADQCIGEPIATGSESSNSFSGPGAPDDPTKGFTGAEIEPPGYASPYN